MRLEVKENTFYILVDKHEENNQMSLFDDLSSSVKVLKEAMKKELNADKFELMSVEYDEEQFKIKTVPWSIIALELIKEA